MGGTEGEHPFRGRYGPWAVIAGASEGLGAAIVDQAAARGCDVAPVARTESKLAEVAVSIEQKFVADAALPRAEVISSLGDYMETAFG